MREQAYRCFEIVAWPALAWGVLEGAFEAGTGEWARVPASALLALMAGAMVVAARWRATSMRNFS